jgi:hypothetical protein
MCAVCACARPGVCVRARVRQEAVAALPDAFKLNAEIGDEFACVFLMQVRAAGLAHAGARSDLARSLAPARGARASLLRAGRRGAGGAARHPRDRWGEGTDGAR